MKKIIDTAVDLLSYRGGQGQWAFILHRLSGLGILVFLAAHVVDTALIGWGPEVYNKAIALYRHPFFRVNEVLLFAAVLYHSINGVRIFVTDLVPGATRHHKKLLALETLLLVVVMVPVSIVMLLPVLRRAG